jgi:hypothetical protein
MKTTSRKRPDPGMAAESEAHRALREILNISRHHDLFRPGETVEMIGSLAEGALHRFDEVKLSPVP